MTAMTSCAITPELIVVGWMPSSEKSPPSVRPSGPEAKNLVFGTGSRLASSEGSGYGVHQVGRAAGSAM